MAEIRGANSLNIRVEGLKELQAQFERIGKMPKKYLTRSAKIGSDDTLKDAKALAPVSSKSTRGTLKKSIRRKMEAPNKRNKSVYRIWFNAKYTPIFLGKKIKRVGLYGGTKDHGFYPISVEYGFKSKKGKVQGQYFVTKAIEKNQEKSLQKIIDSLNDSITELTK